ncbi:MAG: hypothetical protein J7641_13165 [Cyanobacteria bacterium SID2]|nr:hypothetical protein [Cyanobacteria bacterium SID2]MBP0005733.1 hypothetical protein [Cyanobacteria bacterium SBC]
MTLIKSQGDAIKENRLLYYMAQLGEREAVMSALLERLGDEDASVRY